MLARPETLIQDGDLVHIMCEHSVLDRVTQILDEPITEEEEE